jgi:hypothetical protein
MALYHVPGMGILSDSDRAWEWMPEGATHLPEYSLPYQFGDARFPWSPEAYTQEWLPGLSSYAPGYIPQLIEWGGATLASPTFQGLLTNALKGLFGAGTPAYTGDFPWA